ncbi:MAG: hypothetical protein ABIH86_00035 [Planctomycetota bacterium]
MIEPVKEFKFRFTREGKVLSMFRAKGEANEEGLTLDKTLIPYESIQLTQMKERYLAIVLSPDASVEIKESLAKVMAAPDVLLIDAGRKKNEQINRYVNLMISGVQAQLHREALEAKGQAELFRAVQCPHCGAIIDLSELDKTRYSFCRFCETVFTDAGDIVTKGDEYRICPECGYFDRVKNYTEFYFLFLVWFYYISYKQRLLCRNCSKKIALKMFFVNILGFIGWIPTFIMIIQSMTGHDPSLKSLSKANILSQKKMVRQAVPIYESMAERLPEHPGLLFNQAKAHINADDLDSAAADFNRCLSACSNYEPAIATLAAIASLAETDAAQNA